jgi:hypothetical protein
MKSLNDIWDEYINRDGLHQETIEDLIWHLENDSDPQEAISIATDMGLKKLGSHIAKHLDNEDIYIREFTIGCLLGRLQLPEYAEIGFKIAKKDPHENVKDLAIFTIGEVLNKIKDKKLQHSIASYLYSLVVNSNQDESFALSAYHSILAGMGVSPLERPNIIRFDPEKDIDFRIVDDFKNKYGI